jgi:hypothetical protein
MKEIIKRTDKRILVLLVLLFLGVGYSVYRAIDSLSADQKSPEYRRSPPGAFAIPATDTIVENNKLEEVYLPDDIYVQVKAETDLIMDKIASNSLTVSDLTQYGLSLDSARRLILQLRNFSIRSGYEVDPFFTVQTNIDAPVSATRVLTDSSGQELYAFSFVYQINPDSSAVLYSLKIS